MLVVVDRFSRWIKAFPTRKCDATTVLKCLMKDIIPRFGVPQSIDSDRGNHFVNNMVTGMCKALGIEWKLHIVHHPSAAVEKANGTLKSKLAKTCQSTGVHWPDALPLVLFEILPQTGQQVSPPMKSLWEDLCQ